MLFNVVFNTVSVLSLRSVHLSILAKEYRPSRGLNQRPTVLKSCTLPTELYGYGPFNPFPNKPWLLRVCSTSLLKTLWEKEKLLVTSNFSFSRSVFHPFGELSAIFIKFEIVVCKLFQFGRV